MSKFTISLSHNVIEWIWRVLGYIIKVFKFCWLSFSIKKYHIIISDKKIRLFVFNSWLVFISLEFALTKKLIMNTNIRPSLIPVSLPNYI